MRRWLLMFSAVFAAGLALFGLYRWDRAADAAGQKWNAAAAEEVETIDREIAEYRQASSDDFVAMQSHIRRSLRDKITTFAIDRPDIPARADSGPLERALERARIAVGD